MGVFRFKKIKQFKVENNGKWNFIKEHILNEEKPYNQIYLIKDSIIFYNDYPPELEIKKINMIHPSIYSTHKFPMNQDFTNAFFMNNKGNIVASNNGVAYLYYYKDRIDFFDFDLNLIQTSEAAGFKEHIDNKEIEKSILYHTSHYGGEKYLYTINMKSSLKNAEKKYCNFEIFNWNGDAIRTYKLFPAINIFVVDEKFNKIYGYNYDLPNSFYVYNLPLDNK